MNISAYKGDSHKILTETLKNQTEFSTLKMKARVNIKSEQINQSATINLSMKADSIIYGSVTVLLGIEAFRFFISNEEIVLLDRLKSNYYKYKWNLLRQSYPVPDNPVFAIQQVLAGNLYFPGNEIYNFSEDSLNALFSGLWNSFNHSIQISKTDFRVNKVTVISADQTTKYYFDYIDKILENNKIIPKKIEFWVYLPEQVQIKTSYFEPKFNEPLNIDTKIPDSYKKSN